MKDLATAIAGMRRSGIREIMDLAAARDDVLHLEVGEPDFPTPSHIVDAAAEAARAGFTKYTANKGLLEVREVMAAKLAESNGIEASADEIVITVGAISGLMETMATIVDPGDAVLIPDPGWPNYEMIGSALNARVVRYPLLQHRGFEPDLAELERLAESTPGAKALIANSPGNPTGAVFPETVVRAMVDIARAADLYLVSDECYEHIVFEGDHIGPARFDGEGRVVSVFSLSKSYAMTGWRIGYVAATRVIADEIAKVQEVVTSCATAVSQKAAQAAIAGDQSCVAEMRDSYRERRDLAVELLKADGILLSRPRGSFYITASTAATGLEGYEFCRRLLSERGVAVAPGETFGPGGKGMVRLSLATERSVLEEGIKRLGSAVREWST
ncbi:MAG: pyridoxal phosphate-dependent aminotransferase [Acidimicrobiia bacterium]